MAGDRTIEHFLEGPPRIIVEPEQPLVDQDILGGGDPCIEQELRDVLVRRSRGLLQQRLHPWRGANLDALGSGFGDGHESPSG